ncbi:MAG: ABC transporter permease, partial [Acutalibacteraceae bacterium]
MIKTLSKSIREYKLPSILTLVLIMGEVITEVAIPFITARLVNNIKYSAPIETVLKTGLLLVLLAVLSLLCGGIAAVTCANASAGFAKNLRGDCFRKIQSFSFENIDKFASTSLVTRLTTDINYVQMAYMMIIRIAVRSPMMFVFAIAMAYIMGGKLATSFVVVVPVLIFGFVFIAKKALPAFKRVFRKYDKLNESIEENVRGMRVVKGFAREEYEKQKFGAASDDICKDFTKAERIVALNSPIMQFCMYFNTVGILFLGSYLVIKSGATTVDIGQI